METGCERRRFMVTAGVSMHPCLTCTGRVKAEDHCTFHSFQQVNQSHAEISAPVRDSLVWSPDWGAKSRALAKYRLTCFHGEHFLSLGRRRRTCILAAYVPPQEAGHERNEDEQHHGTHGPDDPALHGKAALLTFHTWEGEGKKERSTIELPRAGMLKHIINSPLGLISMKHQTSRLLPDVLTSVLPFGHHTQPLQKEY